MNASNKMKKITDIKSLQKIEIKILDYVVDLCKQYRLTYFLVGGTLLGAIRHKGFIPWDNDIDIAMPRNDYEKLCEILRKKSGTKYSLIELREDNMYYCPFVKVVNDKTILKETVGGDSIMPLGVYIDIFPIDGIKNNDKKSVKRYLKIRNWCYRIAKATLYIENLSLWRKIVKKIWHFLIVDVLKREKYFNRLVKLMKKYPYGSTEYIVSTYGLRAEKEVIEYSAFAQTINVEFEGKMYNAPVGYDKYLTQMYGDYMKLPPESERVAPHDIVVYLKEDSEE